MIQRPREHNNALNLTNWKDNYQVCIIFF